MTAEPIAAPGLPDAFAPATRAWFGSVFPDGPTPVQERAWAAIDRGENALVIAPTGSGKTLAAFLSAIDRLVRDPPPGRGATRDGSPSGHGRRGVRVLYISPLKALGVDVERNLRRPLAGIAEAAAELGAPVVPVGVGVRSGDTPAAERRRLRTRPPDILITTPESLYLMLTSAVRRTLRTVETVIVDEVHSFAATKRGTHLALSLERLDDLLERPAQRIGLSATVAPREEIARFLGGARAVTIVADDGRTAPEVTVTVPVIDMARVPATADRRARMDRALAGPADAVRRERRGRPGRGDDARAWRSDRALRQALARGPDGVNGVDGAGSVSGAPTALLGTGADGGAGGADLGRMMQAAGDDPRGTEGTSLGASKADGETDDPRGTGGTDEAGGTGGAGGTDADGLAAAGPIGGESTDRTGRGRASRTTASIWPHIEEAILDQVLAHRTTLVFANSRGACERLTAHLNEAHAMRVAAGVGAGSDADAEAGTGPGARAGGAAGDPRTTSAADAHGTSPASAGSAEPAPEFAGPAAGRARPAPGPAGPAPEPARPRPKPKPKAAAPARHHESWEMGETKRAQPLPADTPVIARAHHGSVSKEQRLAVERELKSGRLRCVVATASLELGIDMGAIDLVLQVAPPPSIASGLQRVGRADHRVGGRPHGIIYPIERTQLIDAAVAAEGMRAGAIERTALVPNALDVLAQQTVAAASVEDLDADDWYATVRRAAPYRELPRASYDSVLELLAGGYASADLAGFAPRLVRDRDTGALTARPGAQRLAVTASGTIPDRGMFPVVLPEGAQDGGRRRVGELDEEMVNETAVGDIITLGTTSWRVREIGADRVVVDPAPGRSSRLPFWRGDGPGRPAATGAARGAFLREVSAGLSDAPAAGPAAPSSPSAPVPAPGLAAGPGATPALLDRLAAAGLDANARANLVALLREQRAATGVVPTDTTLVLERYEDESGGLRIILHSPYGRRVHEPWAMAIRERVQQLLDLAPQIVVADDGIVLQVPALQDRGAGGGRAGARDRPLGGELVVFDAEELTRLVRSRIDGTALFAARFRECAARALLMPVASPGRRTPLWLQRITSGRLLEAAGQFRDFPVLVEAARECLQDVYDLPALADLMRRIAAGTVRLVDAATPTPSPFARPLLFGYTAALLYQEDLPRAERRAHLLSLDPDALAALVGDDAADLLDEEVLARVDAELQRLAPGRRARPDAEGVADLLRELGPLTIDELAARCRGGEEHGEAAGAGRAHADRADGASGTGSADRADGAGGEEDGGAETRDPRRTGPLVAEPAVRGALAELERARRALPVLIGGRPHWTRAEDAAVLHAALGVDIPVWAGNQGDVVRRTAGRGPLDDLVLRHARTRARVTARGVADAFGLGTAVAGESLARLAGENALVRLGGARGNSPESARGVRGDDTGGARGPREDAGHGAGEWWMAPAVLRRVRNLSLARAREAIRPVSPHALQRLVLTRAGLVEPRAGIDALADAVAALEGVWLPAAAWETTVLPTRVSDYRPAMLDELIASGDVIWRARGGVVSADGTAGAAGSGGSESAAGRGEAPGSPAEIAFYPSDSPLAPEIGEPVDADAQHADEVWALAVRGLATAASFEPVRRGLSPGPVAAPRRRVRSRRGRRRYTDLLGPRASAARAAASADGARPADGASPEDRGRAAGAVGALTAAGGAGTGGGGVSGSAASLVATATWRRLRDPRVDDVETALAGVESVLDRYGVLTPDIALAAGLPGGLGPLMPLLRRMEDTGALLRGRFVEGLGPVQLAERETVEALRSLAERDGDAGRAAGDADGDAGRGADGARTRRACAGGDGDGDGGTARAAGRASASGPPVVVDIKDPACLVGRGVPWPDPALPPERMASPGVPGAEEGPAVERPTRRGGARVVLVDGRPVLHATGSWRSLTSLTTEESELDAALSALVVAGRAEVRAAFMRGEGRASRRVVERVNGRPASGREMSALLGRAGLVRDPKGMRLVVDPYGRR